MSRRSGANKARRHTHDTWETCVDLPAFLADGLFAFMADASYEFKAGVAVPAAYKGKGGTLAAARLVCKDLRVELDSRIRDWMLAFHEKLVHMREKIVRAENVPVARHAEPAQIHGGLCTAQRRSGSIISVRF